MTNSCIYNGKVIHKRFKPKEHFFKYKVFSLFIDLSELNELNERLKFFSLNRFNLISFFEKDHGDRDGSSLFNWVKLNLTINNISTENIKVKLIDAGGSDQPTDFRLRHQGQIAGNPYKQFDQRPTEQRRSLNKDPLNLNEDPLLRFATKSSSEIAEEYKISEEEAQRVLTAVKMGPQAFEEAFNMASEDARQRILESLHATTAIQFMPKKFQNEQNAAKLVTQPRFEITPKQYMEHQVQSVTDVYSSFQETLCAL